MVSVKVIFEKFDILFYALEEITDNPKIWDDVALTRAFGLLQYLNSFVFCFCFFICLFHKILEQSSILSMILQNTKTDFSFGVGKIA